MLSFFVSLSLLLLVLECVCFYGRACFFLSRSAACASPPSPRLSFVDVMRRTNRVASAQNSVDSHREAKERNEETKMDHVESRQRQNKAAELQRQILAADGEIRKSREKLNALK